MNIVLTGVPAREAAALSIFTGVALKGWNCTLVAWRSGMALPPADLYVVDLAGIGLAQWSASAEADLLMLLGGHSALLLTAPTNDSWKGMGRGHDGQLLSHLAKPYGMEDMRAALLHLAAAPAHASVPVPATPTAVALSGQTARAGPTDASRPFSSVNALRLMFPELDRQLLLNRLLAMLASESPQELRLNLHHCLIMHPTQGWVAHNAPAGMLERLAQHGEAVSSMSERELSPAEALQRINRMAMVPDSLDTFLWRLAEASLGQQTPPALRDAELKLRCMPGFTRIPGVGDLYVQLAAICVRLPQTLSSLRAAFPSQNPRDIARFMLLSTASGLGQLRLVEAGVRPPVKRRVQKARPPTGFFRAMLHKLF